MSKYSSDVLKKCECCSQFEPDTDGISCKNFDKENCFLESFQKLHDYLYGEDITKFFININLEKIICPICKKYIEYCDGTCVYSKSNCEILEEWNKLINVINIIINNKENK